MNWFFWKRRREWRIQPQDVHWLGFETSFIVRDGWEPYAVTKVPNALDSNQVRVWTRRRDFKWKRHYREYEIKMQSASWGGHQVLLHLTSGWEPFATSDSFDQHIIWFRKEAE